MDVLQALLEARELLVAFVLLAAGYIQGRRNERRHLAALSREERQLRRILVFASRYPPPAAGPVDPVLVAGSAALAADYFQMFVAGLRKIVGGRFDAYEALISRARRQALVRLKQSAEAAGCTMVFNLRLETTQIGGGARGGSTGVEVLAYGTAFAPAAGTVAESAHHFVPGPTLPSVEMFDLAKNRGSRRLLLVLAAATIYWFAESLGLQDYGYVAGAPGIALALAGLAGLVAAERWLRRSSVPLGETIALCLLVAPAAAAVSYYLLLRANAVTDFSPPIPSAYILQTDLSLRPVRADLPVLNFPRDADYWSVQPKGSEHVFTLRRGWLGFWQFNQAAYHARLRAHFQSLP